MKTIKVYKCDCGEECYEGDICCALCGKAIVGKFSIEEIPVITHSGPITEIEDSLI